MSESVAGSLPSLMTAPDSNVTELPDPAPPVGVLLLQLGTPDSPSVEDVRVYLREFLGDPRVLDMPAPARALLLNGVILPFRPKRSAERYEKIWTEQGSPLTIHTEELTARLQETLGDGYVVAYGMRYGNPPIAGAVDRLAEAGCTRVVVVPLFPHYASASSGSALELALREVAGRWNVIDVSMVGAFFDEPGSCALGGRCGPASPRCLRPRPRAVQLPRAARAPGAQEPPRRGRLRRHPWRLPPLRGHQPVLLPGAVPRHHPGGGRRPRPRRGCPRLGVPIQAAGQKWIEPYTDVEVEGLYATGVRRLAVLTPSFVADCLETLEEIGIRLRQQWADLGGEDLLLVPCINAEPVWVRALAALVSQAG